MDWLCIEHGQSFFDVGQKAMYFRHFFSTLNS